MRARSGTSLPQRPHRPYCFTEIALTFERLSLKHHSEVPKKCWRFLTMCSSWPFWNLGSLIQKSCNKPLIHAKYNSFFFCAKSSIFRDFFSPTRFRLIVLQIWLNIKYSKKSAVTELARSNQCTARSNQCMKFTITHPLLDLTATLHTLQSDTPWTSWLAVPSFPDFLCLSTFFLPHTHSPLLFYTAPVLLLSCLLHTCFHHTFFQVLSCCSSHCLLDLISCFFSTLNTMILHQGPHSCLNSLCHLPFSSSLFLHLPFLQLPFPQSIP